MRAIFAAIPAILLAVTATPAQAAGHHPSWRLADSGSTARLRGLDVVSAKVAWASGSAGTVLRTVDGGRTWRQSGPPDTADLQFRDIEAFSADRAVALSIGEGEASRVYATGDGGRTWTETFRNDEPRAFYDCLAFFDDRRGLALSDPVDGRFRIASTVDGGRSWRVLPSDRMPDALAGEFAFAASGTCLVTAGPGPGDRGRSPRAGGPGPRAWFATGGGATARVFATRDHGRSWTVTGSPLPSGASAGVYSLAFRDPWHGIAVGGDFAAPATAPDGAASTRDGGRTWQVARTVPGEYRSGAAWVPRSRDTALAVGPTGSDISRDGGRTWIRFDPGSFDAVDCAPDGTCWAAGEQGRLARLVR
ncbi:WD40/YVTN/BNR-like repeat-containing protein [Phytohabitans suffuscus]|uniref:Oxidoreductase n=1 Tax=Phytohabitans suffuscus TaxID=624315 RepID=A0A6F8YW57_9ACTN|nr:oxidoreductase [Phytohabitans suffuscus]BCB90405.1 oxidoreductase [Phytohabitans suffuscus]